MRFLSTNLAKLLMLVVGIFDINFDLIIQIARFPFNSELILVLVLVRA